MRCERVGCKNTGRMATIKVLNHDPAVLTVEGVPRAADAGVRDVEICMYCLVEMKEVEDRLKLEREFGRPWACHLNGCLDCARYNSRLWEGAEPCPIGRKLLEGVIVNSNEVEHWHS